MFQKSGGPQAPMDPDLLRACVVSRPVHRIHQFSDSNSIRFTHTTFTHSIHIGFFQLLGTIQFFKFNSDNNNSRFNYGFNLPRCSTRLIQLNSQQPQLNSIFDSHILLP